MISIESIILSTVLTTMSFHVTVYGCVTGLLPVCTNSEAYDCLRQYPAMEQEEYYTSYSYLSVVKQNLVCSEAFEYGPPAHSPGSKQSISMLASGNDLLQCFKT